MRRLCQNSRRWHQQLYRSLDRASHQNCIVLLPPVRQYRQRVKGRTTDNQPNLRDSKLKVREFVQVGPSIKDVVPLKPNAEIEKVSKELKAQIARLDAE